MSTGLATPLPGSTHGVRSEMVLMYAICHLAGVSICASKTFPSTTAPTTMKIEHSTRWIDFLVEKQRSKRRVFISCLPGSTGNTEIVAATENPLTGSRASSILNVEAFVDKLQDLMSVVENLLEDMVNTRRSRRASAQVCYLSDATETSDGGTLTKQQMTETLASISNTLSRCVIYANVVQENEELLQGRYEGINLSDYARMIRDQIKEHPSHGLHSLICELDIAVASMRDHISENIHSDHDVPSSGTTRSHIFDTNRSLVCQMVQMLNAVVSRMAPILSQVRH